MIRVMFLLSWEFTLLFLSRIHLWNFQEKSAVVNFHQLKEMTDPMAPVKLPVYNDKKEIVEQAYVSQCDVARVEKGTLYWRFCHVAIQIRGKRMRLTHFIRGSPEPGWIVNFIDKNPLNHQRRNMFVEKDSEMRGVHKCGNHFHALMPVRVFKRVRRE